ncbi:metal-sulfur cluster assembly factor [Paenibacillus sepulcri]|uniref:Metal-sulfur cluster assembly factor n=1 Tax=Paenibacillus sepulcri TaxID=359917 RepID=A0ABS7C9C6_9BACL|nr:metal-sulfur cluster assembly factor [Paenibacillus sepulcri]
MDKESAIWTALEEVHDPEVGANIVDLGLVYGITLEENGLVRIRMTLTIPECPLADEIVKEVEEAAASVSGVSKVEVLLVWEPKWTPARMNDNAREEIRSHTTHL